MAVSSLSSTICPRLPLYNISSVAPRPKLSLLSFPSTTPTLKALKPSPPSTFTVFAASEMLEETQSVEPLEVEDSEAPEFSRIDIGTSAPKLKIRIKLRSYWVRLIEDCCKQIMDASRRTNAKIVGPVPLPTKKRIYCVLKSPHVHKDARFHFEIRTHRRLIDIVFPTAETIDALMQLDLPPGVDVEVKL